MQVKPDSEGPVERLNSRSTLGCVSGLATFFLEGALSLPILRVKSRSRSIDDSSSVSLAEDVVVQAVPELPLLSEELEGRPSPRDREEPTCQLMESSIIFLLRLTPFEADKRRSEAGESSCKMGSAIYLTPVPWAGGKLPNVLKVFEEELPNVLEAFEEELAAKPKF